jgi:dihydroorotase
MSSDGRSGRRLNASDLDVGAAVAHLELDRVWLVDPIAGREGSADVVIDDGRVTSLDWREENDGRRQGLVLAPGFTDLHAHLREPGGEDAETIASGQEAAAHGGFTTVCSMPDTQPPIDEATTLRAMLARAEATGSPVRVLPWAAATDGRAGKSLAELGDLADSGAVGFSDDGASIPGPVLRNALAYAGMLGRPVAQHAEDRELNAGAEANEGLVATILGLKASPAAAEDAVIARDVALLADAVAFGSPGARLHINHVSTAGGIEVVRRAKAAGLPVTCDVTPHHIALSDEWLAGARRFAWQAEAGSNPWADAALEGPPFDPALKVAPPLRTPADARALLAALADGTVDAIATDHAPRTLVDKEVEFGLAANGMSGLETALGLVLAAVAAGHVSLLRAVEALTAGPLRVLGDGTTSGATRSPAGLRKEALADLVLFDPSDEWLVSESALRSRGKNTPLLGRTLRGRVLLTVAGGRLAYVDPDLV